MHAADDTAIAHRHQHDVRRAPGPSVAQLLADLQGRRLFPLAHVGVVPRIAIVPPELGRRSETQIECLIVRAIYEQHLSSVDEQLCHLGLWRRARAKDDARLRHRRAQPRQCRSRVACAGGRDRSVSTFPSLGDRDRRRAVLERGGRLSPIILDPHVSQSQPLCEPLHWIKRRPPHRREHVARDEPTCCLRLDRQQRHIAPHRAQFRPLRVHKMRRDPVIIVLHVERAIHAVLRADVRDLLRGVYAPTDRALQAHHVFHGSSVSLPHRSTASRSPLPCGAGSRPRHR